MSKKIRKMLSSTVDLIEYLIEPRINAGAATHTNAQ